MMVADYLFDVTIDHLRPFHDCACMAATRASPDFGNEISEMISDVQR